MEEVTFCKETLADFLQLGRATVAHKMSQAPAELPPAILLGDGPRKKRIWLKSSVVAWLKARETQGALRDAAPAPVLVKIHAGVVDGDVYSELAGKRGRGRPRNAATAGAAL